MFFVHVNPRCYPSFFLKTTSCYFSLNASILSLQKKTLGSIFFAFFKRHPKVHLKRRPWVFPTENTTNPETAGVLSALPHVCWLPTDQIGGEADGKMAAKTQSERWSCWNSLGINTFQDFQDLFWVGNEFNDRRTTSILIQYNFMYVHIHANFT